MVMSNAATASNTETVNFANPTFTTRDVMDALPGTGGIAFRDFNSGVIIGIDRVNDRVGINTFTPAYPLDVNGSAQIGGTLNFAGGGTISGGGGAPVSINPGSGITQLINNSSNLAFFNVAQASNVAGAGGGFAATTGTTNSSMGLYLLDQGGSPITLFETGSAVGNTLWRAAAFLWQSAGGTTEITMSPGANTTFVHGIVAGLNTSGTIAGSVCATSGGTLLYESGATGCTISLAALKHDIAPLADASDLMALRPVSFGYNDPKMPQHRFGFIAEQVAAVDPTLSTYDGEGKLQAYDPNGVLALTVAVVQRQEREIRALIVAAVVLALWCAGLTALVVRRR